MLVDWVETEPGLVSMPDITRTILMTPRTWIDIVWSEVVGHRWSSQAMVEVCGAGGLFEVASVQVAVVQEAGCCAGHKGECQDDEHGHVEHPHPSLL